MHMTKPQIKLTPKYLSQIWKCGVETARKPIEASTCMYYHNINQDLTKQFRPARNFVRYRTLRMPAGDFFIYRYYEIKD